MATLRNFEEIDDEAKFSDSLSGLVGQRMSGTKLELWLELGWHWTRAQRLEYLRKLSDLYLLRLELLVTLIIIFLNSQAILKFNCQNTALN